jgi:plasmid stabilization system protein ParE
MRPYEFTPLAEQDLKEIYRYTIKTWGKKQAKHYAGLLEKRFNDIASNTARVRNLSALRHDVMVSRCEHHYIFFTNPGDQKPQIFAVLHERMNQLERFKERL